MDLHQFNNPSFLTLISAILTSAAIGSTAIPQMVDKYVLQPVSPQARALTITRAHRLQHVMVALQVLLACAVSHWEQTLLQCGMGAYVALDAYVAIRVKRQTHRKSDLG